MVREEMKQTIDFSPENIRGNPVDNVLSRKCYTCVSTLPPYVHHCN